MEIDLLATQAGGERDSSLIEKKLNTFETEVYSFDKIVSRLSSQKYCVS